MWFIVDSIECGDDNLFVVGGGVDLYCLGGFFCLVIVVVKLCMVILVLCFGKSGVSGVGMSVLLVFD